MIKKFIINVIKSNTGYSSKTLTVLWAMALSTLMLATIVIVLLVDLFTDYYVGTDLYGIATVIGSIAGFTASMMFGKVYGDIIYSKNKKEDSELNNINKLEDE